MAVKFIKKIREKLGGITIYRLAKDINVPAAIVDNYEKRGKFIDPRILCKIRKYSGMTWNQFGEIFDDEFLEKD